MKKPVPEFSRPFSVAKLPKMGAHEKISAATTECIALATRMGLAALHELKATLLVKSWRGGGIKVSGHFTADLDQVSVVSLESFRTVISADVERYFMPHVSAADDDSELEIDPIEGGVLDLGEIIAEALVLELDPYPRKPGETFSALQEDVPTPTTRPFAQLAALPKDGSGK